MARWSAEHIRHEKPLVDEQMISSPAASRLSCALCRWASGCQATGAFTNLIVHWGNIVRDRRNCRKSVSHKSVDRFETCVTITLWFYWDTFSMIVGYARTSSLSQ